MTNWQKRGIAILLILLSGGVLWVSQKRSGQTEPRTVTAERRQLVQEVTFTGRLEAQQAAELAFEVSGTVARLPVKVGDAVTHGQELARLDAHMLELELRKAHADRVRAQEETLVTWHGTDTEVQNTRALNARILETRRQAVRDAKRELNQVKEVWQQTVRESGDESSVAKSKYLAVLVAESTYHTAQQALEEELQRVEKSNATAVSAAEQARAAHVATYQAAPGDMGLSALQVAVELALARLEKSVLRAPFHGAITAKNAEVGEVVVSGAPVVTVQTTGELEIVADVPETDAAKLTADMNAVVTFDALPLGEKQSARIVRIAPAAIVLEGVPTYRVTLRLSASEKLLKPGFTANVAVETAQKEQVIAIPRRSIIQRGNDTFVHVLSSDGTSAERAVTTGLVGSDGTVEITEGVEEGERILLETPGVRR